VHGAGARSSAGLRGAQELGVDEPPVNRALWATKAAPPRNSRNWSATRSKRGASVTAEFAIPVSRETKGGMPRPGSASEDHSPSMRPAGRRADLDHPIPGSAACRFHVDDEGIADRARRCPVTAGETPASSPVRSKAASPSRATRPAPPIVDPR
jgi:hypothetical protein